MHPMLNIAVKAARRAGDIILRYSDRLDRINITSKGPANFVSEVDHMAESEIIDILKMAYPEHGILAEESGQQGDSEYHWIVDPLDGTTNYLHGYPHYAVSIALMRKGVLDQGVIFDPIRNEMFTASRGKGASLNNRRIRVSNVSRMQNALIGTGFPFKAIHRIDEWVKVFRGVLPRTSGVRRAGSAALDLAHVAAGRFDGFWEMDLSIWDIAAGCLLVQEAGGLITDFDGGQNHLESGDVIAANTNLFSELLDIVKKSRE